jgi:hypothetical protein
VNVTGWLVAGFGGTVVLTILLAGSQAFGYSRMNLPYLLGTMITPDRDRARVCGIVVHLLIGWVFAAIYVATFHVAGLATWWFGAAIGVVHAAFVLAVALPALPGVHPRMAGETRGPTVVAQLEPPGFMARHYGRRTAESVLLGHALFGAIVGLLYAP